jgi:glycosyltransferase involved in cell wall biosynthesis
MSSFQPVIACRQGAAEEIITSGHDGLVVDCDVENGGAEALGRAIVELACDPEKLRRLSHNAIESAQRYNATMFRERYAALYQHVWEKVTIDAFTG